MRKQILAGLLLALLAPAVVMAQSNFTGTWKIDLKKTQPSKKPSVLLLQDGVFSCKSCTPAYTVKADGQNHKLVGTPYADTIAATTSDGGRKVQVKESKNGKLVMTITASLSADGKTLHTAFNDASDTNSDPVTGTGTFARAAAGPAGSEPISGSWVAAAFTGSDNGNTFTLKVEGDNVTMTTPTGQSYTAKLDGADAAYKGDPGITTASVKRIDKNTIEETDKRDGKAIFVLRMTLAADGKSMMLTEHNLRREMIAHDVAIKQ